MSNREPDASLVRDAAVTRAILFLLFWLALSRGNPADLPAGLLAAAAATWTSLRLLPPRPSRPSLIALATYAVRFLGQSIVAGVDVAWRALDPRLPLNPGFVAYRPRLSAGSGRRAFCTVASLQPGTLPVGSDQDGTLLIHCLDVDQPVVQQLSEDEGLFMRALGEERVDG
jgi:multicomponent Na+:H+ antiporter subunit E